MGAVNFAKKNWIGILVALVLLFLLFKFAKKSGYLKNSGGSRNMVNSIENEYMEIKDQDDSTPSS